MSADVHNSQLREPSAEETLADQGVALWWRTAADRLARSAVAWYLLGAAATTLITLSLRFEDWYLFALMSLTTSIVVANYVRLHVERSHLRRGLSLVFTTSVVSAWSALLYERTMESWTVIDSKVVQIGPQTLFWLPVACCALTILSLVAHYFIFVPRARAEQARR